MGRSHPDGPLTRTWVAVLGSGSDAADERRVTTTTAGRDSLVDALATVAIVQLVASATFGSVVATYAVPWAPTLFFVTGFLLAERVARGSVRAAVAARLKAVMVPLAVLSAGAVGLMVVASVRRPGADTAIDWSRLAVWFVPLADPRGSSWEAGRVSATLWFVRASLWVALAFKWIAKYVRSMPKITFVVLVGAVIMIDVMARRTGLVPTPPSEWLGYGEDLALYGLFAALGVLYRDGKLDDVDPRAMVGFALGSLGVAAVWALTQPRAGYSVDHLRPVQLFIGAAWLLAALAARPFVATVAARPMLSRVLPAVAGRHLTIYLWHSLAIVVGAEVLRHGVGRLPIGAFQALLLLIGGLVTIGAGVAFGPIERWASTESA